MLFPLITKVKSMDYTYFKLKLHLG